MRRWSVWLAVVLAGCVVRSQSVVRSEAPPPVVVAVDTFDAHLSPYGMWLVVPGYGRVWQPAAQVVGLDFYPYGSGGTWVYTDAGWVFDSTYPFGWAVFHYGRWMLDPRYGWVWVPGDTWAPAWVTWRTGGVYVGWAPMGPAGAPAFHHRHWCFVETGHFTVAHVHRHHVPEHRFHEAVAVTQPLPPRGPPGPPPAYVSSATRQQVVPVPVSGLRSSGRAVPPPPPPGTRAPGSPPPPATGQVTPGTPPPPTTGQVMPGTPPPPTTGHGLPAAPPPPAPGRDVSGSPPPPGHGPHPATPPPPPPRLEPQRVPAPVHPDPPRPLAPGPGSTFRQAPPPGASVGPPPPPPAKKKTPVPPPPAPGGKAKRPPRE